MPKWDPGGDRWWDIGLIEQWGLGAPACAVIRARWSCSSVSWMSSLLHRRRVPPSVRQAHFISVCRLTYWRTGETPLVVGRQPSVRPRSAGPRRCGHGRPVIAPTRPRGGPARRRDLWPTPGVPPGSTDAVSSTARLNDRSVCARPRRAARTEWDSWRGFAACPRGLPIRRITPPDSAAAAAAAAAPLVAAQTDSRRLSHLIGPAAADEISVFTHRAARPPPENITHRARVTDWQHRHSRVVRRACARLANVTCHREQTNWVVQLTPSFRAAAGGGTCRANTWAFCRTRVWQPVVRSKSADCLSVYPPAYIPSSSASAEA